MHGPSRLCKSAHALTWTGFMSQIFSMSILNILAVDMSNKSVTGSVVLLLLLFSHSVVSDSL